MSVDPSLVDELVRPDVAEMEPYAPIVPFEVLAERLGLPADRIVKLDANENPYGPSPRVAEALARFPYYHIYPDPDHTLLRAALEGYVGVGREYILCGCGSDELIDLIMRLFVRPGETIVNCPPTFGMYPFLAAVNAARTVNVLRRDDFSVDVAGVIAAVEEHRPKLMFVASPNNPDGGALSRSDLLRLLALPLVVVADQAYAEFGGEDFAPLVPQHPNLIVLRTFSKWAGLAGLRVGYGVFPPGIICHLWKIKQPYNVNVAAQAAVLASLDEVGYLRDVVGRMVAERERLFAALQAVPYLRPYPSQSNFILCRVVGRDAGQLKRALEGEGILVRYFRQPGLDDCIRISVGRPEQTEALLAALGRLAAETAVGRPPEN